MAVNIEPRRLPVMREYHALRLLTRRGPMNPGALRTVFTGLIALLIVGGIILLYATRGAIDGTLAFALGSVLTFYFTDPKQPAYGAPAKGEGDGHP